MEFNFFGRGTQFDTGSEVSGVAPLLMFAEVLVYCADNSGFILEAFEPKQLSDEQAVRTFKSMYPAGQHPGLEKINLDTLLAGYKKIKNLKHKSRPDLILMERFKKVMGVVRTDIDRFIKHYLLLFGFHTLKPFVDSEQLIAYYALGDEENSSRDILSDLLPAAITEEKNVFVVTQDVDRMAGVHIQNGNENPPASADILCFPFISFPVLKRLTQEQLVMLQQSLSSAAVTFNRGLEGMQEKLKGALFSVKNTAEYKRLTEEFISQSRTELQKLIDENIYIKQLRNSFPQDGEVHFYIAVSSVEKLLNAWQKLQMFEPYVLTGIMNRISSGSGHSPDECLLFIYFRSTSSEVNQALLKGLVPLQ